MSYYFTCSLIGAIPLGSDVFRSRSQRDHFPGVTNITCTGSELRLRDCAYEQQTGDCETAAIICQSELAILILYFNLILVLQIFKLPDIVTVTLVIFDWSMEAVHLREGLKSVSITLGVLCVTTVSVKMMLRLPVDSLETSPVHISQHMQCIQ
jgi:hypothetical protein